MKDLNLRRPINLFALSGFAVGLVACGGKKDKDDTNDSTKAIKSFCENSFECAPDEFVTYFDDVDDCVEYTQYYVDYYDAEYGSDCADAFVEFLECAAESYQECDGQEDDCEAEYTNMEYVCED